MSINWDFEKDKMGTWNQKFLTKEGEVIEHKLNLYSGNALAVIVYENGNYYNVCGFFADEKHAKNCLGISKEYDNDYDDYELNVTLYKENPNTKKLANLLTRANWNHDFTLSIVSKDLPFNIESEEN